MSRGSEGLRGAWGRLARTPGETVEMPVACGCPWGLVFQKVGLGKGLPRVWEARGHSLPGRSPWSLGQKLASHLGHSFHKGP